MPFTVSLIRDEINFETLPVAKITNYPLEKAAYKPFAQCCLCISQADNILRLRMWAFEVYSSPQSELKAVLYLFSEKHLSLHITITAEDPVAIKAFVMGESGEEIPVQADISPHNGEDLQGVYWGANIAISLNALAKTAPLCGLSVGEHFYGNFYKLRDDADYSHMGSYAPANFPDSPFDIDSMDIFSLVSY